MFWRCGQGCLLLALLASLAGAAEIPWQSQEYFHAASNEPLVDLLRQFAGDQNLPLVMTEKVTGSVSGRFGPMEPQKFLDQITRSNGLVWYYDGHVVYIYRSDEMTNKLLPVSATTPAEMIEILDGLDVLSDQFPVKALPDASLLYVVGPPQYVELLATLVETVDRNNQTQANVDVVVEIFPLKYAWADDQSFAFGDSQITVPGVVTILRNILSSRSAPGGLSGRSVQSTVTNNLPSLRGRGLLNPEYAAWERAQQAAVGAQIAAAQANATAAATQQYQLQQQQQAAQANAKSAGPVATAAGEGVIESDPRLNAVIIRDIKEKIPYYARIIRELDRPGGLVQIEATIIDVDANSGFDWGMPYLAQWRRNGNLHSAQVSLDANLADPLAGANMGVTVLRNGATDFLARLRAMETDGHARIVSRPSVLTINNVEAQLESIDTFFVRVEGNQEVDLFNVSVGTTLRIVPHIVDDPAGRRVKLIVKIEDGRQKEDEVDDIPIINRNVLNTQAVLSEGESLLVGGLIREEQTKNEKRIPVLGRIPKVGVLFKTIDDEKRKLERLVLITPTIMDLPECVMTDEDGAIVEEAASTPEAQRYLPETEEVLPSNTKDIRPTPSTIPGLQDQPNLPIPEFPPEAATPTEPTTPSDLYELTQRDTSTAAPIPSVDTETDPNELVVEQTTHSEPVVDNKTIVRLPPTNAPKKKKLLRAPRWAW